MHDRSAPFDLQQIGDNYIKLEHPRRQETIPLLVRVSIVMQEATIFVFLETEKAWPYGIVNLSSVPVAFSQEVCSAIRIVDEISYILLLGHRNGRVQVEQSSKESYSIATCI